MLRLAILFACAVLPLATAALAQTARLDRPIARVRTIRSEIRRGNTDAFDCFMQIADKTAAADYANCVTDKITTAGYDANPSKAYLLGAYATGLEMMGPMMEPTFAKFHDSAENTMAANAEVSWRARLKAAVSATGLTRADFCIAIDAADLTRCKSDPLPF